MSTPTAKDLLAQADRLMRQRIPQELPVLTDLVIEEIELTSLTDRMDDVIPTHSRPAWMPAPIKPSVPSPAGAITARLAASPESVQTPPPARAPTPMVSAHVAVPLAAALPAALAPVHPPPDQDIVDAADVLGMRPRMSSDMPPSVSSDGPVTVTAMANVREQFNAQLVAKLAELQHGVYSQVMQQLEIYAAGALKDHIRDMLLPALTDVARDIAQQVAEDTSTQVREVVSKAVDTEIARLRDQLSKRRT